MVNIAPPALRDDERRFIDEIAALLAPRGMPPSAGRVYGYILLREAPVSLDQIAADLEISRGGAWNAAKVLERCGQVRRHGERGSKRALYGPSDNHAAIMLEQTALLGSLGDLLQGSADDASSDAVAARFREMAHFYLTMRQSMEATIRGLNASRQRKTG